MTIYLDRLADVARAENPNLDTITEVYEREPGLRVPDIVTSINPRTGEPRRISVSVDPSP